MQTIREQIKSNNLDHVYLLYGEEQQVVRIYRNKLLMHLLGSDSLEVLKQDMNFSLFVGSTVDPGYIIEMAQSYPFMAEKRVVLVENSRLFNKSNPDLEACIKNLPETSYLIFTETDKPNKKGLYEAIKEAGHIAEINEQKQEDVEKWIIKTLSDSGKRISKAAMDTLIMRVGLDMMRIGNELEKLIAYKGDEQDIKAEDVIALVEENPEDQIFKLIDAMSDRKPGQAMKYYLDLLELKRSPQDILRLIERQMRILYQVKDLRSKGFPPAAVASSVKDVKNSFFANKYINQASRFSMKEIADCMADCVDLTLQSRTGALTDKMAVELIIVKYSNRPPKA